MKKIISDFIADLLDGLKTDNKVMDEEYRKLLDKGIDPLTDDRFSIIK